MVTHSALFVHKFTPPPDLQKLSRRVAQLTSARSAGLLPFRHVSRRNRKNTPAGRGRSAFTLAIQTICGRIKPQMVWQLQPSTSTHKRNFAHRQRAKQTRHVLFQVPTFHVAHKTGQQRANILAFGAQFER